MRAPVEQAGGPRTQPNSPSGLCPSPLIRSTVPFVCSLLATLQTCATAEFHCAGARHKVGAARQDDGIIKSWSPWKVLSWLEAQDWKKNILVYDTYVSNNTHLSAVQDETTDDILFSINRQDLSCTITPFFISRLLIPKVHNDNVCKSSIILVRVYSILKFIPFSHHPIMLTTCMQTYGNFSMLHTFHGVESYRNAYAYVGFAWPEAPHVDSLYSWVSSGSIFHIWKHPPNQLKGFLCRGSNRNTPAAHQTWMNLTLPNLLPPGLLRVRKCLFVWTLAILAHGTSAAML